MTTTAIVWYRRDLRVHDHPALRAALDGFDRVVPAFVLDDALLRGRYASGSRTAFMLGCLRALDGELRARGGGLVVRHGPPAREIAALAAEVAASAVLWTSDVSPYARARDRHVTAALQSAGTEARPCTGGYCVDVGRPRTRDGRPFRVFSPFWRAWRAAERRPVGPSPRAVPVLPAGVARGRIPSLDELGLRADVPEPVVEPGEASSRAGSTARSTATPRATTPSPAARAPCRRTCAGAACPRASASIAPPPAAAAPRRRGFASCAGGTSTRTCSCTTPGARPPSCRSATAARCSGTTTPPCCAPGRRGAPASRSSTPGCASSRGPAGCTTARGS